RMGDFYEMFFEDAEMGGRYLDLTVTSRDKKSSVPAPMSGFPHHQLPAYLSKALAAGLKVAVCDQLEDPSQARGIVRRGITQVVTPGVVFDQEGLQARANNFLAAVLADPRGDRFALAAMDVSTGEFRVTEVLGAGALRCEISRVEPRELVLEGDSAVVEAALEGRLEGLALSRPGAKFFTPETARKQLFRLIGPDGDPAVEAVEEFGFGHPELALRAAGAVAAYVDDTQQGLPDHARLLTPYRVHDTLVLDETAKANLELFRTLIDGRKRGALLGTLDRAVTAMGGRRLRHWLAYPLVDPGRINARLDAVGWLRDQPEVRTRLRASLQQMYDLERLNARIAAGRGGPRDLWFLRVTLEAVPDLLAELADIPALASVTCRIDPLPEVAEFLARAIADDPPGQLRDGGVIREGFDADLDELVDIATHGKDWILRLEAREREATGIGSLKVRFN
ncbi:MAG: DNA mismatch repair protein MutS, partial [Myxococcales bacterium]|nr:DNA mismatch repair protein MutS [Myxococcales bacterium]